MLIIRLSGEPRFPLGRVYATPGVLTALGDNDEEQTATLWAILARHVTGDWGEVGHEDSRSNEEALQHGARILSVYTVRDEKIWLITEADRSATTALLPEEY